VIWKTQVELKIEDGVYMPYVDGKPVTGYLNVKEYFTDLGSVLEGIHNSLLKSFCMNRNEILQKKFDLHLM
jgi:hypothetical protein